MNLCGQRIGERQGESYPIRDNGKILAILHAAWQNSDPAQVAATLLADTRLWGEDLSCIADLAARTAKALCRIQAVGVRAAMREAMPAARLSRLLFSFIV